MDFKSFKKVSDDKDKAVMMNDAGHKIHIVKGALTGPLRKRLEALPLYQSDPQSEVEPHNILSDTGGGTPTAPPTEPVQAPVLNGQYATSTQPAPPPQPMQPEASQGPKTINPNTDYTSQMPGGAKELAGAKAEAKALSAKGEAESKAFDMGAQSLQHDYDQLKSDTDGIQSQIAATTKDIADGHIRPNAYLEDMSTGSKIATSIGLLLGGIGAGMTGGPNVVSQFLEKQIDRNLEAQKANLANKHNLLSALGQQYSNVSTRDSMFRAINANIMAAQVNQAAAAAQSPLAKANLLKETGNLQATAAQYARQAQMAHMQDWVKGAPSGQQGLDARAQAYQTYARTYDPKGYEDFSKRYIPGVGVASVPLEAKDREALQKKTELNSLLNEADAFLKKSGKLGPVLPADRATGEGLQNRINLRMGELADLTRFTPEENKIYRRSIPTLGGGIGGTHFTDSDQNLLNSLKQENNDSLNTFYKQKGLSTVTPAGNEDKVTVISPNGQSGTVSRGSLAAALAQGYKQVK